MNKKFNLKSFALGACAAFTLTSIVSVGAMNIDVIMNDIKVYWDGVEKTLTNVRGEKVEPIIYQGTTYVPVRAMSNLMGKEVSWNQEDMAVYVGKKPTMRTIPLKDMKENINGKNGADFFDDRTYNLKNVEFKPEGGCIPFYNSYAWHTAEIIYVLDGKFSNVVGKLVMPYEYVGASGESTITFYSVENDGTKNKIKSFDLKQTEEPVEFDVNLIGVTNLMIQKESEDCAVAIMYDTNFLGE